MDHAQVAAKDGRRARRRRPRMGDWISQATFTRGATRADGMHVAVMVACKPDGSQWVAFALETPADEIATVLEAHAHVLIATCSSPTEALAAAEEYQARWLTLGALPASPACACGEIGATP
jgi:hypothetical protein